MITRELDPADIERAPRGRYPERPRGASGVMHGNTPEIASNVHEAHTRPLDVATSPPPAEA